MRTHRIATAGIFLAVFVAAPIAFAQAEKSKEECAPGAQPKKKVTQKKPAKSGTKDTRGAKSATPSSAPAAATVPPAAPTPPPRKMEVTTIAGLKAINQDDDLDMSVGTSELTSAAPGTRDVIESRPERRREQQGRRFTAAPLFGYGTADLGIGVGARGGYTFPNPIYVGGTFMYHGGGGTVDRPNLSSSSMRFYYPGVEVGYDIGLGPMLLRPYVGGGILFGRLSTVDTNGGAATNTESAVMVYPGVTAQYVLPRSPLFVGGDARLLLPFENQAVSLSLFATTGLYL